VFAQIQNFFGDDGSIYFWKTNQRERWAKRQGVSPKKKRKRRQEATLLLWSYINGPKKKEENPRVCLSPNPIRFLLSSPKKTLGTSSRPSWKEDPRWLISFQVQILSIDTKLGDGGSIVVKVQL
jgi:hypothetical protein